MKKSKLIKELEEIKESFREEIEETNAKNHKVWLENAQDMAKKRQKTFKLPQSTKGQEREIISPWESEIEPSKDNTNKIEKLQYCSELNYEWYAMILLIIQFKEILPIEINIILQEYPELKLQPFFKMSPDSGSLFNIPVKLDRSLDECREFNEFLKISATNLQAYKEVKEPTAKKVEDKKTFKAKQKKAENKKKEIAFKFAKFIKTLLQILYSIEGIFDAIKDNAPRIQSQHESNLGKYRNQFTSINAYWDSILKTYSDEQRRKSTKQTKKELSQAQRELYIKLYKQVKPNPRNPHEIKKVKEAYKTHVKVEIFFKLPENQDKEKSKLELEFLPWYKNSQYKLMHPSTLRRWIREDLVF